MRIFPSGENQSINTPPLGVGGHRNVQLPERTLRGRQPCDDAPVGEPVAAPSDGCVIWAPLCDTICAVLGSGVWDSAAELERVAAGVGCVASGDSDR